MSVCISDSNWVMYFSLFRMLCAHSEDFELSIFSDAGSIVGRGVRPSLKGTLGQNAKNHKL